MATPPQPVYGDRYEPVRLVARGGMAEVWLAHDGLLDRRVALKVLFPELSVDHNFVERFRREAQAAANLSHPNIVSVYDWGEAGGMYFIVMEYVDGPPLSALLRSEGPLLADRAVDIAADVAAALGFAHRNGVIHRDVKPGNVLIPPDDQVKVTDFGIARAVNTEDHLTQTGAVMGTATYFSPEQAQGGPIDQRSDVYALGVVLYEMVTGRPPFIADGPVAVAYKHVHEEPPPPSVWTPELPPGIEAVILQAMAKDVRDRYASAEELRADLIRFRQGRPVLAEGPAWLPTSPWAPGGAGAEPAGPRVWRTTRRRGGEAAVARGAAELGAEAGGGVAGVAAGGVAGGAVAGGGVAGGGVAGGGGAGARSGGVMAGGAVGVAAVGDGMVAGGVAGGGGVAAGAVGAGAAGAAGAVDLAGGSGASGGAPPAAPAGPAGPAGPPGAGTGGPAGAPPGASANGGRTQTIPAVPSPDRTIRPTTTANPPPTVAVPAADEATMEEEHQHSLAPYTVILAILVVALVIMGVLLNRQLDLFDTAHADAKPPATIPVTVPAGLVGESYSKADNQAAGLGVQVNRVDVQNNHAAVGTVIAVKPPAGQQVQPGGTLELDVSSGVAPITEPDVVGETAQLASEQIQQAGFTLGPEQQVSSGTVAAGQVITTNPPPIYQGQPGDKISLVVSSGPGVVPIPNETGKDQTTATSDLTKAGFQVEVGESVSSVSVPVGSVVATEPAAGTPTTQGDVVAIEISAGPADVLVPYVLNYTQANATADIQTRGLVVAEETEPVEDPNEDGVVLTQDPGAGVTVKQGSTVNITVGVYQSGSSPPTSSSP